MACTFPCNQGIVVGGGLAGVSAGNTLLECGANVVLLDKSAFCGGNSTKDLRALPPKKAPAAPAGEKAPAAPAAEAVATTKVVKPGWEATYNAERWENKSHPRKHFVRGYKNYVNWSAGPSFHDKVRSKLSLDVEAPLDEPLMEYYERPSTLLNMHYFPLPDERGQNAIIPTFNQNKYTYQIIIEWGSWILESCSSSCVRKTQWVCLILFLLAVSFFFIDLLPGEKTRFGIQDFSGTHVEGGKTLILAPPE